jgi:FixJ family two-component response regulator
VSDGRAVLVLEDEPIVGLALEDMILSLGDWNVTLLARIEDSHAYLEAVTPAFAVLDVNIHGQLSYGVADRLQEVRVPYFFATGYGDRTHPERHAGAPTVTKPYTASDIERAIAKVIGEINSG